MLSGASVIRACIYKYIVLECTCISCNCRLECKTICSIRSWCATDIYTVKADIVSTARFIDTADNRACIAAGSQADHVILMITCTPYDRKTVNGCSSRAAHYTQIIDQVACNKVS